MNKAELQEGVISIKDVQQRIVQVREQLVIIDADVASLYGVETKRVNEAVRNNPEKFPDDYMFELDDNESRVLRSKFSTLEHVGKGHHSKYNFKAFTEKGLAGSSAGGFCRVEGELWYTTQWSRMTPMKHIQELHRVRAEAIRRGRRK